MEGERRKTRVIGWERDAKTGLLNARLWMHYRLNTSPQSLHVASFESAFIACVAFATALDGSSKRTVVSSSLFPQFSQTQINRSHSSAFLMRSTTKVHEPSRRRGEWGTLLGKRNRSPALSTAISGFLSVPR